METTIKKLKQNISENLEDKKQVIEQDKDIEILLREAITFAYRNGLQKNVK